VDLRVEDYSSSTAAAPGPTDLLSKSWAVRVTLNLD